MLQRVFIITGESSGELIGSLLGRRLFELHEGIKIAGVGGEKMRAAGIEIIAPIASSFGAVEAIRSYPKLRKTFNAVVSALETFNPQVIVLIDYPDFNMPLAGIAKKLGIKVLYYVSPQVWAWRSSRVKKLRRIVDRMALILPFEEEFYRHYDVSAEFVGNPVMNDVEEVVRGIMQNSDEDIRQLLDSPELKGRARLDLGLDPDRPVVTLMPGSRLHEVQKLMPEISGAASDLKKLMPGMQFVLPMAPNMDRAMFEGFLSLDECRFVQGDSLKCLAASDSAVIASGTSTLQAAMLKVPMVVVYKLSPVTFFLGRMIVKVNHISLVNLLLERSCVDDTGFRIKELLQKDASRQNILAELLEITIKQAYRKQMINALTDVRELFLDHDATARVAEIAEELVSSATDQ
ncbi:MAG: lipid-A-disaccharide synthase [Dissulfurispiraceae bacterium]|jgi:lipid-A-disaccharide synthase|nr:lipid-A-disaccharide synthase [Dissulfurispiraceae bacterium]